MSPSPSEQPVAGTSPGERELEALASQAGLLRPGEALPDEMLEFGWLIVHACAQIGDAYWREDTSAGQHIRAVMHP